jgi:basic amino acid/polyamine antiporter, APA family
MTANALPRVLDLRHLVAIVIGAIIGVGIFFTPAQVARIAGSEERALLLWAVGGACAAAGGVVFGELGRRFPHAGGQYRVMLAGWGPFAAFVYVVSLLTAIQPGAAAIIAHIAARNLALALGVSLSSNALIGVALALIGAVVIANTIGVRQSAGVQLFTVTAKLATLGGIVALAIAHQPAVVAAAGLLPAMFSYGGWQHALWMAGEVRDPERTLPRGIGIGVAVVILAYVGAAWAYFELLGFDGVTNAKALAAEAVAVVLPGAGARVVAGAVAISAFGVLNAQFLAGPRQVWALARDGLFFGALGHLHPARSTPHLAILALGVCASTALVVAGPDGVGQLTAWTVVVDTLFFALTALVLLKLQWAERRATFATFAAVAFVLIELAAMVGALASPQVRAAALTGLGWVLGISLLYLRFRRSAAPDARP